MSPEMPKQAMQLTAGPSSAVAHLAFLEDVQDRVLTNVALFSS